MFQFRDIDLAFHVRLGYASTSSLSVVTRLLDLSLGPSDSKEEDELDSDDLGESGFSSSTGFMNGRFMSKESGSFREESLALGVVSSLMIDIHCLRVFFLNLDRLVFRVGDLIVGHFPLRVALLSF